MIRDRYSDRSKGFAFVEMSSISEAETAMQGLNGTLLDGRQIRVDHVPQTDRREVVEAVGVAATVDGGISHYLSVPRHR